MPTEKLRADKSVIKLLRWERVIKVEEPPIKVVPYFITPEDALMMLANVNRREDIGKKGPVISALPIPENRGISSLSLFGVPFPREHTQVSLEVRDVFPQLLRSSIFFNAETQGIRYNLRSEEEPGRVVHEYRLKGDPNWEWPYYGAADTTPMQISAIARQCETDGLEFLKETYKGRDGHVHSIEHSLKTAVDWLLKRTDTNPEINPENPEGLLEFKPMFKGSIENQAWKDSWDSYHHKDGTIASHEKGIASVEVQALAYDACIDAANIYRKLGNVKLAQKLEGRAANLKKFVLETLWMEDERGGYFALGTDRDEKGNLRVLDIRTSNMGLLLNSEILAGDDVETKRKRDALVKTLFSEEMMATNGIRTLSNKELRFRPGAYHNGNVWLGDNHRISLGLEKYGYYEESEVLDDKLLAVVKKYKKYPENARGGNEQVPLLNTMIIDLWDEKNNRECRIEQPPQEIQAWTVAAVIAIMHKRNILTLRLPDVTALQPKPAIT